MSTATRAQEQKFRCQECTHRLFDYENGLERGYLVIEVKCPSCGEINRLNIRS
jgi:phage FluMu protein Com